MQWTSRAICPFGTTRIGRGNQNLVSLLVSDGLENGLLVWLHRHSGNSDLFKRKPRECSEFTGSPQTQHLQYYFVGRFWLSSRGIEVLRGLDSGANRTSCSGREQKENENPQGLRAPGILLSLCRFHGIPFSESHGEAAVGETHFVNSIRFVSLAPTPFRV
jgi:hypothetical protein